mmetsp:Transcript_4581/g.6556  ORF Transcript_4581/g.6556 Transcript_4581/m.6556 type:complete len:86 (+) Transcript_4581:186-443(+)
MRSHMEVPRTLGKTRATRPGLATRQISSFGLRSSASGAAKKNTLDVQQRLCRLIASMASACSRSGQPRRDSGAAQPEALRASEGD